MSYVFNPFTGNFDQTSSTSPGGTDTQVQFNDGGSFAGASGLLWNKTTNTFTVNSSPPALTDASGWLINSPSGSATKLYMAAQLGGF